MSEPIFWDTHKNYIIRDIDPKTYSQVSKFMVEHFLTTNILYKDYEGEQREEATECFLKYLKNILHNECSFVIINEHNEIFGVALCMWMTKEWRSWAALKFVEESDIVYDIIQLRLQMITEYKRNNDDTMLDSLNVFHYYIAEELRSDKQLMCKFYSTFIKVARHMKMPSITYIAFAVKEQNEAKSAGFHEAARIIYSLFVVNERRPYAYFRESEEMFAILYVSFVEPLIPYYEMTIYEPKVLELP